MLSRINGRDAGPHGKICRTGEWYEAEKRAFLAQTGALDDLYQEYPATDAEAMAPRSLDKRLPAQWLQNCYRPQEPVDPVKEDDEIPE